MNTKKVVTKMVKMTTRSGSGNAPDPDSNVQEESRPPAKPKDSTPEPSDRHNTLSFFYDNINYKNLRTSMA